MRESCKEFILFHQSVFNKKCVIFSQSNVLNNRVFFFSFEKTPKIKPNKNEMFKHFHE